MSKRPGEGGGPDAKRAYGGPGQEFMDSEPMLPEEYEDPDDEDVFLNDVMDQKVRAATDVAAHPRDPPARLDDDPRARRVLPP